MEMEKEVLILNLDDVLPNRFQPRIKFNEQNILELAESIKEHGVIQPIVVRKISDKYEIIAGERRYKASVLAGKTTIPAIVTNLNDKDSAEIALIENVQRQDLTPIEEAVSYKKILDMGYLNQITLAEKLGKKQSTIANKLRLLNLADDVQEALLEEKISERHARSLLRLDNENQLKMLNRILDERMTVRKTDDEIIKVLNGSDNIEEPQEIEILDFDNPEMNKKEENMNNEVMNQINIPTTQIISNQKETEDLLGDTQIISNQPIKVPPFYQVENNINIPSASIIDDGSIENQNIKDEIKEEEVVINPGFMDIDRIENQAKDIYPKEESSLPLEEIEQPSEVIQSLEPQIQNQFSHAAMIPPTEEEAEPSGGRFFNIFNMNNRTDPDYVSDLESQEVNMNFESTKIPETFQFNPFINQINKEEINNLVTEPTIQSDLNQEVIPQFPTEELQIPIEKPKIEIPINNVEPIIQSIKEESIINPINTYSLNDEEEFTNTSYNELQGAVEKPLPYGRESGLNNELPVTIKSNETPIIKSEFRDVISAIRNCTSLIEKYGYNVETDELDFENLYQVTFKIDK